MSKWTEEEEKARDARDLRVCEMIDAGYPYSEIRAETGATTNQICCLARELRKIDAND